MKLFLSQVVNNKKNKRGDKSSNSNTGTAKRNAAANAAAANALANYQQERPGTESYRKTRWKFYYSKFFPSLKQFLLIFPLS